MWRLIIGKYKGIVAAIGIFIVLDAGVLLLNFYTTYEISDDAHAIRLATRQSMLSQRIFHSLEQMQDDLQKSRSFEESQNKLAKSYKQFDEVLDAFIYGGTLIGRGQGQDELLLDDSYQHLSEQYLIPAESLWKPFRLLVGPLVYAEYYDEDIDLVELLEKADLAVDYSAEVGDSLLESVSHFSASVEKIAHKKAVNLRTVQAVAIGLAVINFFIILFHFIKRLNRSDELAERFRDETTEILRTVNDGLFLLDTEYKIGSQYSSSMNHLFRRDGFSGETIFNILADLVSTETLEIVKDYIDSLFNQRVKSSLIDELNPLQEVEINIAHKHGFSNHFFTFTFSRVYQKENIVHLLVSVKDITDVVELRGKLEYSQGRVGQEAESFVALLNIDEKLLKEFLVLLENGLLSINEELERPEYHPSELTKKLDKINRVAHSLKGEASMLGLGMVEENIHILEDRLSDVKAKGSLEGDDFLPVTVELTSLLKISESIKLFLMRFSHNINVVSSEVKPLGKPEPISPLHASLTSLAKRVSENVGKQVRLDLSRFNEKLLPNSSVAIMTNVLIQLIRNAIVHGLETPKKRAVQGKSEVGVIEVSTQRLDDNVVVVVKDDGNGINFSAIKKYLLDHGGYSIEQVKAMKVKELLPFIFKPGFSTANKVSNDAGRGVGLDIVKESVNSMGAYLSVGCKSKYYSEFRIRIPVKEALAKIA